MHCVCKAKWNVVCFTQTRKKVLKALFIGDCRHSHWIEIKQKWKKMKLNLNSEVSVVTSSWIISCNGPYTPPSLSLPSYSPLAAGGGGHGAAEVAGGLVLDYLLRPGIWSVGLMGHVGGLGVIGSALVLHQTAGFGTELRTRDWTMIVEHLCDNCTLFVMYLLWYSN